MSDDESSALALTLMHPLLASAEPAATGLLLEGLKVLPEIRTLTSVVGQLRRSVGHLDTADTTLITTLEAARDAAIRRIQAGGFTRSRAASPDFQVSGLLMKTDDDTDPSALSFTLENWRLRWVHLWAVPVDSRNHPVGSPRDLGLVPAAGDVDTLGIIGSYWTGEITRPSRRPLSLSLPPGATEFRIEGWGIGFADAGLIERQEFVERAGDALAFTILLTWLRSGLGMIAGVSLLVDVINEVSKTSVEVYNALTADTNFKQRLDQAIDAIIAGNGELARLLFLETVEYLWDYFLATENGRLLLEKIFKRPIKSDSSFRKALSHVLHTLDGAGRIATLASSVAFLDLDRARQDIFVGPGRGDVRNLFQVTLSWDVATDVDLHTFAPSGKHCWYGNKEIPEGFLDVDDIDGFGPENFTLRALVPGRYRIGVNYYRGDVTSRVRIEVATRTTRRTFGPHILLESNRNGGYPIRGDTESWWRPCDLIVGEAGQVQIVPPQIGDEITRMRSESLIHKK
jgi:hypothetical protein